MSAGQAVQAVLNRQKPERFVYAPNYWQWFAHAAITSNCRRKSSIAAPNSI